MYLPRAPFSRTDENAMPAMTEASLLPFDLPEVRRKLQSKTVN